MFPFTLNINYSNICSNFLVADKDNSNTTLNSISIPQGPRNNELSVRRDTSSAKSTKDACTKSPNSTALQSSSDGQTRVTRNIISETQTSSISEQLKSKIKRDQEISLAVTLVIIALLFICCQSVKLIADVYELIYCDRPSVNTNSTIEMGEYTVLDS